jgi:hypothetical protein
MLLIIYTYMFIFPTVYSNLLFFHFLYFLLALQHSTMVVSSYVALNKIDHGGVRALNGYIARVLGRPTTLPDDGMPLRFHFLVAEKFFRGTNMPLLCCPIQLLLRDGRGETILCQPVWSDKTLRSKVNRKVKFGTKKYSVIRLDDFGVLADPKASSGYVFLIRSYQVVKKDIDEEAYHRWAL